MMWQSPQRIGLVGGADWFDAAAADLDAAGYAPVRLSDPETFIDDLLDAYPVLLVVDADNARWRHFLNACKTDQATRRLPVIVVATDPAREANLKSDGADVFLTRSQALAGLLKAIETHALRLDPAVRETLRCQCQDDLPPLAQEGVAKFNRGAYYAQHDAFEAQWMRETGPVRDLYRVVLQVGVAYYHITRGNHAGGLKMLRRVEQWFARLPDTCQGIDLKQLRADAARVRAALAAMDPADIADFDRSLLKPVPLRANDCPPLLPPVTPR